MQASSFQLPLIKKEQVTQDVVSFYFDSSRERSFGFVPGQYVRIIIPEVTNDPRGNSRMFSIASSPTSKDFLMLTTKISKSIFKQHLSSLSNGQTVQFFGPVGRFALDMTDSRSHIFLAGGIGITPFHSMLVYAADTNLNAEFSMIVSFSTPDEMVYFEEMEALTSNHPNIKTIYSITRAGTLPNNWRGESGRITAEMIKEHNPNYQDAVFYICGSQEVTNALKKVVLQMNVKEENIRKEQFVGY